mmetsp:Transcript_11007/g.22819  ORF Transcript_11007/g.22819 Transcript_11007/m.22819 type:complete len:212 (+) Transcript_11007:232-867(+)
MFFPSKIPGKDFVANGLWFVGLSALVSRIVQTQNVPFVEIPIFKIHRFRWFFKHWLGLFSRIQTLQELRGSARHSAQSVAQQDGLAAECLFCRQPRFVQDGHPVSPRLAVLNGPIGRQNSKQFFVFIERSISVGHYPVIGNQGLGRKVGRCISKVTLGSRFVLQETWGSHRDRRGCRCGCLSANEHWILRFPFRFLCHGGFCLHWHGHTTH